MFSGMTKNTMTLEEGTQAEVRQKAVNFQKNKYSILKNITFTSVTCDLTLLLFLLQTLNVKACLSINWHIKHFS